MENENKLVSLEISKNFEGRYSVHFEANDSIDFDTAIEILEAAIKDLKNSNNRTA